MATLQDDILRSFARQLSQLNEIDDKTVRELTELFESQAKPRPADVVEILSVELEDAEP